MLSLEQKPSQTFAPILEASLIIQSLASPYTFGFIITVINVMKFKLNGTYLKTSTKCEEF